MSLEVPRSCQYKYPSTPNRNRKVSIFASVGCKIQFWPKRITIHCLQDEKIDVSSLDGYHMSLPNGLGNLTSLEVLKKICATLNIVKELHKLSMLRELKI
ncbi:hypothetical protein CFC21_025466 [Triticum aestivum]|uniref:Uncharacterized protein n=2 Tax=Triticum aestivum TaxID=4565 RepID=A0A9R1EIR0_WHEAT|nr:hypothetical protein CFC21_025466 [Triticum aestivum]